jgi:hypothetical protein
MGCSNMTVGFGCGGAAMACDLLPRNKDERKVAPFLSLCKASSRAFCRTLAEFSLFLSEAELSLFLSEADFGLLSRCLPLGMPWLVAGINHSVALCRTICWHIISSHYLRSFSWMTASGFLVLKDRIFMPCDWSRSILFKLVLPDFP